MENLLPGGTAAGSRQVRTKAPGGGALRLLSGSLLRLLNLSGGPAARGAGGAWAERRGIVLRFLSETSFTRWTGAACT